MVTSDGSKLHVFYYRDFTVELAVINEPCSFITFDITGNSIIASEENKVKLLSLKWYLLCRPILIKSQFKQQIIFQ